ncbi:HIT family protein [Kiritimatiella glycovorans]|uniref:HIT-like protein n=1 Tax=Kiritimatiella glycovorans TaxID=1307763 RepID=A0A0G3EGI1_9BACT|nr:HIT family protein [Kiritimatiella glycovorans]AKJ65448.1 HIT-like protein [Kiritimatiella glycovorans]
MEDCIFCRIVRREIPAEIVWEDEALLAFMDIGPIIRGHTLVIPKVHHDPIEDTPDEIVAALFRSAKRIAAAQRESLGAEGINIIQNNGRCSGQAVFHIHVHVIPRYSDDGHHWNWDAKSYGDPSEMADLADKIRGALA